MELLDLGRCGVVATEDRSSYKGMGSPYGWFLSFGFHSLSREIEREREREREEEELKRGGGGGGGGLGRLGWGASRQKYLLLLFVEQ